MTMLPLIHEMICNGVSRDVDDEVAMFLADNGLKYVNLVGFTSSRCQDIAKKGETFLRFLDASQYLEMGYNFHMDADVILIGSIEEVNLDLIMALTKDKIQRTLIVVQQQSSESKMSVFRQALQNMKMNSIFYLLIFHPTDTVWYQAITLKSGYALEELEFAPNSYLLKESFNMQGLKIRSISETWEPYLTIEGCNEDGINCSVHEGYIADFVNILAERFNFTYSSEKEPNGNWGILPKSGPFNLSGEWDGVLGNVVNGKYDLSMSSWDWILERQNVLQFVLVSKTQKILVWEPKNPEIDFGIFIRPITSDSWLAIFITICVTLLCIAFVSICHPSISENSDGRKLMVISIQYFFIFINAYYGGALTMFFTSSVRIPFETLRDTLQAHPEWKLKYLSGDEVSFVTPAVQGDQDYVTYWNYAQANLEEASFPEIKEGLAELKKGQTIIFLREGMLKGYLKKNPTHQQKLQVFWRSKAEFGGMIFPLNSPLTPIFRKGAAILRENGIQDILAEKWEGKAIGQDLTVSTMVLGSGHMALVFVIMVVFYFVCFVLFLAEVSHSLLAKAMTDQGRPKGPRRSKLPVGIEY